MTDNKTLLDFPQEIRECLCIWESFRKAGFPARKLFFAFDSKQTPPRIGMMLNWNGKTVVAMAEGTTSLTLDEAKEIWQEAGALWNLGSIDESAGEVRRRVWEESKARQAYAWFLLHLHQAGVLPLETQNYSGVN